MNDSAEHFIILGSDEHVRIITTLHDLSLQQLQVLM